MFASTLRRSVLLGILGLFVAVGAAGADDKKDVPVDLKVGDPTPAFQLRNDADKIWNSSDHFAKKWVVIYFYPGDFTPGCTAQAKAFNAAMDKLTEKGVEVVGVSGDSVRTHELFKKTHKLSFTLLADSEGTVAKQFGVPVGKGATVKARDAANKPLDLDGKQYEFERTATAARWTFIIDKAGKVAYKNIKVVPPDDAKKITEFIEKANEKK
ncbi:peroxiredoxin [Limnoglobus roseus]|uniref:thioredoxin-dependent peroxiredoxin n=1 Tax=Limnoglobus roseus TaxID=2598579 RepID=A0A5C1AI77_9BACT|nr:peroxiredoxin [Limnoglobus roseus]QEL18355.1 peroxiredoxin [Limnoglobus roseus]